MGENVLFTLDTMMEWGPVWARAVTRAWQDPNFKAALKRDPAGTLYSYFQFTLPPTLELQVVEVDPEEMKKHGYGYKPNDGWLLPRTVLKMVLPPAPAVEMQAVAITDYIDSGNAYPFTCFT
jgi:ribosomally synthesized peptide (two-chain TOMM family)